MGSRRPRPKGPLTALTSLDLTLSDRFMTLVTAPLKVVGCAPVVALKRRGGRVTVRVKRGRDAPAIRRVTLNGRRVKSLRTRAHRFRVVVRDASGASWTFRLRR